MPISSRLSVPTRATRIFTVQGLEIGFHTRPTSGYILATIGRNGDIKIGNSAVSDPHCSFKLHGQNNEEVMLQDQSKDNTTQPSGLEEKTFSIRHPHRSVLIDREINQQFGIGGTACDLYEFKIHWHNVEEHMLRQYIDNKVGNPSHARTVADEPPTSVSFHPFPPIRYSERQKLGRGAFGSVRKVVNVDTGEYLAMKRVVRPLAQVAYAMMRREVDLLSLVSHRNIIELITFQETNDGYFEIFMPVKTGSVQSLIIKKEPFTTEPASARPLLHQMLQALDCLNSHDIIHRDVKPDNILYTPLPDGKYLYQLADFGLANTVDLAQTEAGSDMYMAPEIRLITGQPQTTKMDIWSLFVTLAYAMDADGFREKLQGKWPTAACFEGSETWQLRSPTIERQQETCWKTFFDGEGRTTFQN
ncbi:hypothetical protein CEP52_006260 [Fusarium oligoseptatum]|uniref:non-specific serine/threonine protein kinase n=1 Tax=Fusarium oligoseptatum TaxID=2604345 RepID=A0A428TTX4_9HYPO|nr:hypothetical protein CEP52_006260 [Fusarium oligoseptatum]